MALLCLDKIWSPFLMYRIHFKFQDVIGKWIWNEYNILNEYKSPRMVVLLCGCHAAILFSCGHFPPEVITDFVIYDCSLFVCRNKELGNELQSAYLVAKAFQKLKMSRGLYNRGMVGVAKANHPTPKVWQDISRSFFFSLEIHKWPLIFFLKSSIVFLNTFCGQILINNFGLKSLSD